MMSVMHRRAFVGATAFGIAGLAGCLGGSDVGEVRAATPAPTATPAPATTPAPTDGTSERGQGGATSGAGGQGDREFASGQSLPDLRAEPVSVSGVGNAAEAGYFTARGGPVLFRFSATSGSSLVNNFFITVVGDRGIGRSKQIVAELAIHEVDVLRGRVIDWLAPDEYKLEIGLASGVEWTVTVEQPGLFERGDAAPLVVEGEHRDVVGPVSLVGATRATLETLDTRYVNDQVSSSNHIVRFVDQRSGRSTVVINELDVGPRTYSNVFDGSSAAVGYFEVTGTRLPWRLTVEPI
jgi:hypothetical protein